MADAYFGSDPCPTTGQEECGACTGEECWLCGAGCWDTEVDNCDHEVCERHDEGGDASGAADVAT